MRKRLMKMWREAKALHTIRLRHGLLSLKTPIKRKALAGAWTRWFCSFFLAGSERTDAASNVYTIKNYGPDRVAGFCQFRQCRWFLTRRVRAISRCWRYLLKLLRLVLRPASCVSATWGEQTDVPESADWYNSSYTSPGGQTCRRRVLRMLTSLLSALQRHQNCCRHTGLR